MKSQNGIKNGRKKTLKGKVKDALAIAEDAMPEIIAALTEQAKNGNIQAASILLDRIYGKPTERHEISGNLNISELVKKAKE